MSCSCLHTKLRNARHQATGCWVVRPLLGTSLSTSVCIHLAILPLMLLPSTFTALCWYEPQAVTYLLTSVWLSDIMMVCSTKVLSPQNLFSRKLQRYKGHMSHYVDTRHLWTHDTWHLGPAMFIIYKIMIIPSCKQNVNFHPVTGNKYSMLLCHLEVNNGLGIKSTARITTVMK